MVQQTTQVVPRRPQQANGPRTYNEGYVAPHPSIRKDAVDVDNFVQDKANVYSPEYLSSISPTHHTPTRWFEFVAWWWHLAARTIISLLTFTWVNTADLTPAAMARRLGAFSSVGLAGGVASAAYYHARSMLLNVSDNGWVHTSLGVAENARMHGMIIGHIQRPNFISRAIQLWFQMVFFFPMLVVTAAFPSIAKAYEGYRAEEQMYNYTQALKMMEIAESRSARSDKEEWETRAPAVACNYYGLAEGATVREVLVRMRADEACNKHMAMVLAALPPGAANPFIVTSRKLE